MNWMTEAEAATAEAVAAGLRNHGVDVDVDNRGEFIRVSALANGRGWVGVIGDSVVAADIEFSSIVINSKIGRHVESDVATVIEHALKTLDLT